MLDGLKNSASVLVKSISCIGSGVSVASARLMIDYFTTKTSGPATTGQTSGKTIQPTLSSVKKTTVEADFELAGHTIKVARSGLMAEVRTLPQVHSGVSPSLTHDIDRFVRGKSKDHFSGHALPNELLSKLNTYVALTIDKKSKGLKTKEGPLVPQTEGIAFARCLISACKFAAEVFRQEPRLLKIDSPVYIMGDLHGNFPCLANFENVLWRLGPSLTPCNLLFLGDYVDRGSQCVEVVAYLIAHKLKCTKKVFLIRGNHEIRELQKSFSFPQECCGKFGGDVGQEVWRAVNDVFDTLPLAAVVDGKVFCCHGGIPPPWLCPMIASINTIPCPLAIDNEKTNPLAWDLMWNDPIRGPRIAENTMIELAANSGFAANVRRRTGHIFTVNALEKFLLANGLSHVVRAHEAQEAGYQVCVSCYNSFKYHRAVCL